MGYLFGATKQSTAFGCLCWAWVHMGGATLCTKVNFHKPRDLGGVQVSEGPRQPLPPPSICLHLPAACEALSWKEPLWVRELCEVGSQEGREVFMRSIQIQTRH